MLNALFPSFSTFLLCLLSICPDNSILIQKPHSHLLNKASKLHAPTFHKHLLDPTYYTQRVNTLTHFRKQNSIIPKIPQKNFSIFSSLPYFLSFPNNAISTTERRSFLIQFQGFYSSLIAQFFTHRNPNLGSGKIRSFILFL